MNEPTLMIGKMLIKFEKNVEGRDFVVGDIHGCFHKLQEALTDIEFDESKDRLFSVGDLVDRGPESDEVVEWLSKPWFHAIRGNHEQMAIDFVAGFDDGTYEYNGGRWLTQLPKDQRSYYTDEFKKLPFIIEVGTPSGLVGLVHAECMVDDWEELKKAPQNYGHPLLWGRDRIRNKYTKDVKNVGRIYVGHTPVTNRTVLGNHIYIDMGVCFKDGGKFHIERIN